MSGIPVFAVLALSMPVHQPLSYQQAHAESVASKRPMLILVGADWCPACRTLKNSTMPRLLREGKLRQVAYAVVDVDREPRLASQLMRSSSIPQLVLYAPATEGWYRLYLHGAQSSENVLSLIEQGIARQRQDGVVPAE